MQLEIVSCTNVTPRRSEDSTQIVLFRTIARYPFRVIPHSNVTQHLLVQVSIGLKQHNARIDSTTLTPFIDITIFIGRITCKELTPIYAISMNCTPTVTVHSSRRRELEKLIQTAQHCKIEVHHQYLGILCQTKYMKLCKNTIKACT